MRGMASTGVHSNGFSLVRKIFKMDKETLNTYVDELGKTLGEALLAPTRIYVGAMKSIKNAGVRVKACSHITGGGFYENIPRMLPEGKHALIEKNSYPIPPIFTLMAKEGTWKGTNYLRELVKPANPNTPLQQAQRGKMSFLLGLVLLRSTEKKPLPAGQTA